jgi:hypothetical protein
MVFLEPGLCALQATQIKIEDNPNCGNTENMPQYLPVRFRVDNLTIAIKRTAEELFCWVNAHVNNNRTYSIYKAEE